MTNGSITGKAYKTRTNKKGKIYFKLYQYYINDNNMSA